MSDNQIKTPEFRVNFMAWPGENGRYQITAMFPKDTDLDEMHELARRALKAKHGPDAKEKFMKMPFLDGDDRAEKDGLPQFEGMWYCNIASGDPIAVIDESGKMIDLARTLPTTFSGCYMRAYVDAYGWTDPAGTNKGVSFGLKGLQRLRDGERLAGGAPMSVEQIQNVFADGQAGGKGKGKGKGKGGKKGKAAEPAPEETKKERKAREKAEAAAPVVVVDEESKEDRKARKKAEKKAAKKG